MNRLQLFIKKFLSLEKELSNRLDRLLARRIEKIKLKQYNGQEISEELEDRIKKEVMLKLSMIPVFIFFLIYIFLSEVTGVFK